MRSLPRVGERLGALMPLMPQFPLLPLLQRFPRLPPMPRLPWPPVVGTRRSAPAPVRVHTWSPALTAWLCLYVCIGSAIAGAPSAGDAIVPDASGPRVFVVWPDGEAPADFLTGLSDGLAGRSVASARTVPAGSVVRTNSPAQGRARLVGTQAIITHSPGLAGVAPARDAAAASAVGTAGTAKSRRQLDSWHDAAHRLVDLVLTHRVTHLIVGPDARLSHLALQLAVKTGLAVVLVNCPDPRALALPIPGVFSVFDEASGVTAGRSGPSPAGGDAAVASRRSPPSASNPMALGARVGAWIAATAARHGGRS